jgi:hypothetical protein
MSRLWLRFSLRSLFVAVTVVAVALGMRERPPQLRIELGQPRNIPTPEGFTEMVGQPWVSIPVRMTNVGRDRLWFDGYAPDAPFYEIMWRSAGGSEWEFGGRRMCGTGVFPQPMAAGKTVSFVEELPPEYRGRELMITLGTHHSDDDERYFEIMSDPVVISTAASGP